MKPRFFLGLIGLIAMAVCVYLVISHMPSSLGKVESDKAIVTLDIIGTGAVFVWFVVAGLSKVMMLFNAQSRFVSTAAFLLFVLVILLAALSTLNADSQSYQTVTSYPPALVYVALIVSASGDLVDAALIIS